MPLIIILLKVNITLALCYLLYYVLLRKLTFYQLNRAFFLGSLVLSGIMPLIRIRLEAPASPAPAILVGTSLDRLPVSMPATYDYSSIVQWLFLSGLVFMGFGVVFQLLSIARLYKRSRRIELQGLSLRQLPEPGNPFSFFRSIFLHPGQHSATELNLVIAHEQVHVRQWHSIDILVAAIARAFCWFNPIAWLLLKAMKQNLEFIADHAVLQEGAAPKAYQYSLLRISQDGPSVAFANNFNFSHIKTRIIMMNKKRSSPIQLTRYMAVIPLALTLVCSFGISMAQQKKVSVKDQPATEQQTVTQERQAKANAQPAAAPKEATFSTRTNHGEVTIQRVAPAAAAAPVSAATVQTPPPVVSQEGAALDAMLAKDRPVVVFDGARISYDEMKQIDPKTLKSVTILKGADALALYGDEAKGGVILITSNPPEQKQSVN
ncbi:M56 family metallopeptidase [Taibaiella chishuiensis]|uniref:Beta-lactamase regulating signal transducer with metallopeptidase domain n=1 Tax=Taibaiella chishuiensis TaxID=1434707 RepID=A0A2P8DA18_9BACT|nr:M56 family metallopeptidase [Taibaiella chishuiensis]PSK94064.1 beta-lactamase regulating signal transducer with metallopeptidase domain [Taibaiella chishuiensis]